MQNLRSTNRERDLGAAAQRRRGKAPKIAIRRSESILFYQPLEPYVLFNYGSAKEVAMPDPSICHEQNYLLAALPKSAQAEYFHASNWLNWILAR